MFSIIKRMFRSNSWAIAYRINNHPDLDFSKNKEPFSILSFPKGYWGADPFLLKEDNVINIYCEYMDIKKSKAIIAYKEIYPRIGDEWLPAYEFDGHTSYPCVFNYKGESYMIPETVCDSNIVILKKRINQWHIYSVIKTKINAPDTTFFMYDGRPCIFVYEIIANGIRKLHIIELNSSLNSIINDYVVKTYDSPIGRGGGSIIKKDDNYYRVTQCGVHYYGEKIDIISFSYANNKYVENGFLTISPNNLSINQVVPVIGIHTYNRVDNVEVIDLLMKGSFNFFKPIKYIFKRFGLFGYGLYEAKRKRLLTNQPPFPKQ